MGRKTYHLSFILIFLLFAGASVLWPHMLTGDLLETECDIPPCLTVTPDCCELNPSFSATFDPTDCTITLFNVWNFIQCTDPVYLRVNQGNWVKTGTGTPLTFPGIEDCRDIQIARDENGAEAIPYSGLLSCDCGPCSPNDPEANASIMQVLANPKNNYLNSECCCTDYSFVFPNGMKVNAVVATMHLRVEAYNNKTYIISSVDEENKIISLGL